MGAAECFRTGARSLSGDLQTLDEVFLCVFWIKNPDGWHPGWVARHPLSPWPLKDAQGCRHLPSPEMGPSARDGSAFPLLAWMIWPPAVLQHICQTCIDLDRLEFFQKDNVGGPEGCCTL